MDDTKNPQKEGTPQPKKKEGSDFKHGTAKASVSKKENANIVNNENDKNMELHVKPKEHKEFKIKFFLYEFFIIFLAVSVSFFVENIRERYIEHHKELQYVKSLVNDVKLDTASLTSIINFDLNQLKGIDTLLKEIEKPESKRITNYLYHYSFAYLSSANFFTSIDRTISQLKNAGGLRLIQSKAASDSIITYDGSVQDAIQNTDYCLKLFYDLSKQQKEILDLKTLRTKKINNLINDTSLRLLNNDPIKISLFYNETLYYASSIQSYRVKLIKLKKQATNLLETLEKEYDLE